VGNRIRIDVTVADRKDHVTVADRKDRATVDVHGYKNSETAIQALIQCSSPEIITKTVMEFVQNGEMTLEVAARYVDLGDIGFDADDEGVKT
jgi:hypothetical protein